MARCEHIFAGMMTTTIDAAIDSINVTDLAGYTVEEMGAMGPVQAFAILDNGWEIKHGPSYPSWEHALDAYDPEIAGWGYESIVMVRVSEIANDLFDMAISNGASDLYRDCLDRDLRRAIEACDRAINF